MRNDNSIRGKAPAGTGAAEQERPRACPTTYYSNYNYINVLLSESRINTEKAVVLNAVETKPGAISSDIAKALGMPEVKVREILHKLFWDGYLSVETRHHYYVSAAAHILGKQDPKGGAGGAAGTCQVTPTKMADIGEEEDD